MSRPLRIEYPDAWYHVMNRGRRGENIFADSDDYKVFIALLQETSEMFNFRVGGILPDVESLPSPRADACRQPVSGDAPY